MRDRVLLSAALLLAAPAASAFGAAAVQTAAAAPAAAAAAPAPVRGAKELFYDPTGGTVASAQPLAATPPPAAAAAAAQASDAPAAAAPAAAARRRSAAARRGADRRQPALPAKLGGRDAPLAIGISYWIELVEGSGGPGTQVTDARTFHSGERIRLHFRSNADGEVALIQLGASGMAAVLFPDPAKGLPEGLLLANQERILPSEERWFRFDATAGTEKLLVLFARDRQELERFPLRPAMDRQATMALVRSTQPVRGSKDLFVETESEAASEIGTYGVNVAGQPVVLEINLKHH
jgi:hypothetical protein